MALYERGYDRQEILELYRFIDWLLRLPAELTQTFKARLARFEEEGRMVYITQGEELAKAEGLQSAVFTVLETRFGPVSGSLASRIREVLDAATLEALVRRAVVVASANELFSDPT